MRAIEIAGLIRSTYTDTATGRECARAFEASGPEDVEIRLVSSAQLLGTYRLRATWQSSRGMDDGVVEIGRVVADLEKCAGDSVGIAVIRAGQRVHCAVLSETMDRVVTCIVGTDIRGKGIV